MSWAKHKLGWALAGGLLVGAIAFATIALGAFDDDTTKGQGAAPAASEADGVGEGIEVHGDWVIEVRNADGSVAERREFENALFNSGSHFLDLTLARTASVGEWAVLAIGATPPCPSGCAITELGGTHNWGFVSTFATLQLSTQQSPNQFIVQGNFNATNNGSISDVETRTCYSTPPSLNPGACNNAGIFTATTLQTPVNVVAGQQVLVTVRISFS